MVFSASGYGKTAGGALTDSCDEFGTLVEQFRVKVGMMLRQIRQIQRFSSRQNFSFQMYNFQSVLLLLDDGYLVSGYTLED